MFKTQVHKRSIGGLKSATLEDVFEFFGKLAGFELGEFSQQSFLLLGQMGWCFDVDLNDLVPAPSGSQ